MNLENNKNTRNILISFRIIIMYILIITLWLIIIAGIFSPLLIVVLDELGYIIFTLEKFFAYASLSIISIILSFLVYKITEKLCKEIEYYKEILIDINKDKEDI